MGEALPPGGPSTRSGAAPPRQSRTAAAEPPRRLPTHTRDGAGSFHPGGGRSSPRPHLRGGARSPTGCAVVRPLPTRAHPHEHAPAPRCLCPSFPRVRIPPRPPGTTRRPPLLHPGGMKPLPPRAGRGAGRGEAVGLGGGVRV